MPEAAGTPARPGLADSAAGKEFGTARTAPHSTERGERSTSHSGRKRGGVRTTGVAGDREPQREPVVDRADRAVSLLDLPRADRSKFRYLVRSRRSGEQVLACLLWSSPAWKMAPRDQWIGWNQEQKAQNLQLVVNNGRYLILPWVHVRGLASKILGQCARQLPGDWELRYGYRPLLLETLVDARRFRGTCYRAANWILVGQTQGRGRMDSEHRSYGLTPKDIYLYPLCRYVQQKLCQCSNITPSLAD